MTILNLPMPISVNALFMTGKFRRARSQKYDEWIQEAGWSLKQQRPIPVFGQVVLIYRVQELSDGRRRDIGNFEKCVTDLLVSHGIIEGDDQRFVREIRLSWSKEVSGVEVKIQQSTTEQRSAA